MAHQIIDLVESLLGLVGFVAVAMALIFASIDVIETYLKFRRHLYKGDFFKSKERE